MKNFKAEEKINQEKYIEKPANVAHEIASFFDIEQYLLGALIEIIIILMKISLINFKI
ncbi:hypothetical protein SE963_12390 [Escherichia coli]|nr:hypothetical protein [Escherichia coli]